MIIGYWDKLENWIVGIGAGAAVLVFLYGMLARFAFPQLAPDWVLDVTIFTLVWVVFLSGSLLVSRSLHVRADLIFRLFSNRGKRVAEVFNSVIALAVCATLCLSGIEVVRFAIDLDERTLNTLRFPMAAYYACLPVAMGLMTIRYILRIWRVARHGIPDDEGHHPDDAPQATALN